MPPPTTKAGALPPLPPREQMVALLTSPVDALAASATKAGPVGALSRDTPDMRLIALAYAAVLALAASLAFSVVRSLRRFDRIASELAYGRAIDRLPTALVNVRELTGAMTALDRLILDLRHASERTRQAAEDNAHAMRTPLGTIMGSLEVIRRGLPADNKRAWRAVEFIDVSAGRLAALVSEAHCRQVVNADQVIAPRRRMNFSELVAQATRQLRKGAAARNIRLVERLDEGIFVRAPGDALKMLVDEVLDEACLAMPAARTIVVTLTADRETVRFEVDVGRTGSIEGHGQGELADVGAVQRTVEALGGRVVACPGLPLGSLAVELPRS